PHGAGAVGRQVGSRRRPAAKAHGLRDSRTPAGRSPPVTTVTQPEHAAAVTAERPAAEPSVDSRYSGTVQKVMRVVRQGADVPGMKLLGKVGNVLGPALRHNTETHQYV